MWCWSPCCLSLSPSLPLSLSCLSPSCLSLSCPSLISPVPAPFPVLSWPHPALSSASSCLSRSCLSPFCLLSLSPLVTSCLSPFHLAPSCPSLSTSCLCPSRFDLLPNLPVPTLPCSHPVCPHPIPSPSCLSYPKRSTRMEWEVPCSGPSCILPGQGQLRWDFPSIDWISYVLGEFYLTAAGGCE